MTTIETLRSLQKRVREATGPDRELDGDIIVAFKGGEIVWKTDNYTMEQYPAHRYPDKRYVGGFANEHVPCVTASLDACVALMQGALPGLKWVRDRDGAISLWEPVRKYRCKAATDPLANDCLTFLYVIVSAKIAELEAEEVTS